MIEKLKDQQWTDESLQGVKQLMFFNGRTTQVADRNSSRKKKGIANHEQKPGFPAQHKLQLLASLRVILMHVDISGVALYCLFIFFG